jgi:hypothetical protein
MAMTKTGAAEPFKQGQPGRPRPTPSPAKQRPTQMPSTVPSAPRVTKPGKGR